MQDLIAFNYEKKVFYSYEQDTYGFWNKGEVLEAQYDRTINAIYAFSLDGDLAAVAYFDFNS